MKKKCDADHDCNMHALITIGVLLTTKAITDYVQGDIANTPFDQYQRTLDLIKNQSKKSKRVKKRKSKK